MGRRGKIESRRYGNGGIRSKDNGSDESDEDYAVGEDEEFNDSEEYCPFSVEESEGSLGELEEEEDEEEEKVRKVVRPKRKKVFTVRKKSRNVKARKKRRVSYKVDEDDDFEDEDYKGRKRNGIIKSCSKRRVSHKVDDDEDFEVEDCEAGKKNGIIKARNNRRVLYKVDEDEAFEVEDCEGMKKNETVKAHNKRTVSYKVDEDGDFEVEDYEGRKKNGIVEAHKKRRVSYKVDDDEDFEDEDYKVDDDDDEEFTPGEVDSDYEDDLPIMKRIKKVGRPPLREKGLVKGRKRKRNSKVSRKPVRKKPTKNRALPTKVVTHSDRVFTNKNSVAKGRSRKNSGWWRSRSLAISDSDFMSSGSSDFEYTISEEEREQVREASEFCRDMTISLRNSSSTKRIQGFLCQQTKDPEIKGKEKIEDVKNETGKQVCGICLSQEGKKTVRGTLNCCSHYFCFACIMEWSKVESRCPLCKQRFMTISKPARSSSGFDLRTMVVQVPERDQVYQPSEEELRGYLDPYENVICTECQQGGDDALMLLCDLCDSPSHTYCVGLGCEVPEGNWYCEGCRPTALGSSNPQVPVPTPDQRTSELAGMSSPIENVREVIDLNTAYVPETPEFQGTGVFSPPGYPVGDFPAASPASGLGVSTLSERRRIQRQIHHFINNRLSQFGGRTNEVSATALASNVLGSQVQHGGETASQSAITPERLQAYQTFSCVRLQDNFTPVQHRSTHSRVQLIQGQASTSGGASVNGMPQAGLPGFRRQINSRGGYEQLRPCASRSTTVEDSMSSHRHKEVSHLNVEKEQVQKIVRSHLKSLSREMELGYDTFKNIARKSTHSILAACGLEHRGSALHLVQPPRQCIHLEEMDGGQVSLLKGCCYSCFDSFVKQVVGEITNAQMSPLFRIRN
ncbi:hypothetical protein NMG60_11020853 [Bertholletia excelsa]